MTPMGFLQGASYVPRGLWFLLRHPVAWPFAVLPLLVNAVLLIGFLFGAWLLHDNVSAWIGPDAPPQWLAVLVWIGALLIVLLGAAVSTLLIGAILAGPFQEKLSEVIEGLASDDPLVEEGLSVAVVARDALRTVRDSIEQLAVFLLVFLPLLASSFLPVVGIAALVLLYAWSSFFLALQFSDPYFARRKVPRMEKIGRLREQWAMSMGFGFALTALMVVPLLQIVLSPALVVGGTLMWIDVDAGAK
jgi:CysZ protein